MLGAAGSTRPRSATGTPSPARRPAAATRTRAQQVGEALLLPGVVQVPAELRAPASTSETSGRASAAGMRGQVDREPGGPARRRARGGRVHPGRQRPVGAARGQGQVQHRAGARRPPPRRAAVQLAPLLLRACRLAAAASSGCAPGRAPRRRSPRPRRPRRRARRRPPARAAAARAGRRPGRSRAAAGGRASSRSATRRPSRSSTWSGHRQLVGRARPGRGRPASGRPRARTAGCRGRLVAPAAAAWCGSRRPSRVARICRVAPRLAGRRRRVRRGRRQGRSSAVRRPGRRASRNVDRLAAQPARGERERLLRRAVEPLHVVDGDQHRPAPASSAQRRQHGQRDHLRPRAAGPSGRRGTARRPGRAAAAPAPLQLLAGHPVEEVDQPRERQARLGLAGARHEHPHALLAGPRDALLPQARLADPGRALEDERADRASGSTASDRRIASSSASRPTRDMAA